MRFPDLSSNPSYRRRIRRALPSASRVRSALDLPSTRQIGRALRRNPYLPGRPTVREDSRLWAGVLLGFGLGAAVGALLDPQRRAALRARIGAGAKRLRSVALAGGRSEDRTVGGRANAIEESIEVGVPVERAYEQWTRFEEFPAFMEGVVSVRRDASDGRSLHWEAEVAGVRREWDAEITEQSENQRVAWCSTNGARNAGVVTFHHLSPERCKVMVQMEYEPEGPLDAVGDRLGFLRRRVAGDLERFRERVERRSGSGNGFEGLRDLTRA